MTYAINIDQVFAQEHGLTLTQAASLSAFMSLPIWSKAIVKDGEIWYTYSDEKMSQDFPLLFGVPKRCYKNLSELEALGFVVTGKEKKVKIVRFTSLCDTWNKEKSENGLKEKATFKYEKIIEEYRERLKGYTHKDQKPFGISGRCAAYKIKGLSDADNRVKIQGRGCPKRNNFNPYGKEVHIRKMRILFSAYQADKRYGDRGAFNSCLGYSFHIFQGVIFLAV